jgi:hypothetical protein
MLVMNGNHPFSADYTGKGARPTLQKRIAQGHWPYGNQPNIPYKPRKQAPSFHGLPVRVQELMRQCFEDGHRDPARRPTAAMWEAALGAPEPSPFDHLLDWWQTIRKGSLRRGVFAPRYRWAWITTLVLLLILLLLVFLIPILRLGPGEDKDGGRSVGGKETPRLWNELQGK